MSKTDKEKTNDTLADIFDTCLRQAGRVGKLTPAHVDDEVRAIFFREVRSALTKAEAKLKAKEDKRSALQKKVDRAKKAKEAREKKEAKEKAEQAEEAKKLAKKGAKTSKARPAVKR